MKKIILPALLPLFILFSGCLAEERGTSNDETTIIETIATESTSATTKNPENPYAYLKNSHWVKSEGTEKLSTRLYFNEDASIIYNISDFPLYVLNGETYSKIAVIYAGPKYMYTYDSITVTSSDNRLTIIEQHKDEVRTATYIPDTV